MLSSSNNLFSDMTSMAEVDDSESSRPASLSSRSILLSPSILATMRLSLNFFMRYTAEESRNFLLRSISLFSATNYLTISYENFSRSAISKSKLLFCSRSYSLRFLSF